MKINGNKEITEFTKISELFFEIIVFDKVNSSSQLLTALRGKHYIQNYMEKEKVLKKKY